MSLALSGVQSPLFVVIYIKMITWLVGPENSNIHSECVTSLFIDDVTTLLVLDIAKLFLKSNN